MSDRVAEMIHDPRGVPFVIDTDRCSGRTKRMLEAAIELMHRGKTVLVIAPTDQCAENLKHLAVAIDKHAKDRITFTGLDNVNRDCRGKRFDHVAVDNSMIQHLARQVATRFATSHGPTERG